MKTRPAFRLIQTGSPAAYILATAIAALLAAPWISASDFSWDPADDANGGANIWDTTSLYWDPGNTAVASDSGIQWTNSAANNAFFAGSGGMIALGTSISAGVLNFSSAGYIINTGTNTLTLNSASAGSAATINFDNSGTLALLNSGDGMGSLQSINFLENVTLAANSTISVNRSGSVAINKTLQLGELTLGANALTVSNSSGFGLEFTGATTLTAAPTLSVANIGASNVVSGLTLTGPVSGGFGLTKSGAGTLVLASTSNTFGSGGSLIDVTGGILQAASNGALGDGANVVRLSANSATQGLRLTGGSVANPYAYTLTGRTINLNAASSGIDVTEFTTATLDTALASSAATNTLQKNDNGVLAFASGVDNSSLTGAWTINAGAIRISNNLNLNSGATALTVASRSALQLTGGANLNRSGVFTLNGGGFSNAGALQSVGGSNTVSSLITLGSATTIGADMGSSLNISGGIAPAATTLATALASGTAYTTLSVAALPVAVASGQVITLNNGGTIQNVVASAAASAGATSITVTSFTANAAYGIGATTTPNIPLTLSGGGTINISSTPVSSAVSAITHIGGGTLAITANSAAMVTPITLDFGGTLSLSGAGVLGGGAGTTSINSNNGNQFGRIDNTVLSSSALAAGFQVGSFVTGQMVIGMSGTTAYLSGSPSGTAITSATAVNFTSGVQALGGSSIVLDNSSTNMNNRLGGRAVGLGTGGSLTLTSSAAGNVSETVGGFVLEMGHSTVTLNADPSSQTNFIAPGLNPRGNTEPTALIRGSNLGSAAGPGVATFKFTAAPTFVGITTATGTPTTQGILPQVIVDSSATGYGTSFATTSGAGQVLRPLTAGELTSGNAMTAAANVLVSAASTTSAAWTSAGNVNLATNSLTLNSGGGVNIAAVTPLFGKQGNILTITSGGLLATGTNSISGGILQWGGGQLDVFTPGANAGASTLTISSRLASAGLVKAGGGTLVLSNTSPAYPGLSANAIGNIGNHASNVYINDGTLKLAANNAISTGGSAAGTNDGSSLTVSGTGILDLNGHTQWVGKLTNQFFNDNLSPANPLVMAGGTITNTSASPASLLVQTGNPGGAMTFSWGGTISGNVGFSFYGSSNKQNFQGPGTYTGPTLISAANLTLRDFGTMSGTSTLEINSTTFTVDNNGGLANINNRLNGSGGLLLNNGTLAYQGRAQTASVDGVGAATLNQGVSVITVTAGGTGVNSADFSLGSLARTSNSAATVEFSGNGTLGAIGSGQGRISITAAPALTNNIIGPWALANGNAFATYIPYSSTGGVNVGGVGGLGSVGCPAFDSTAGSFNGINQPSWNASAGTVAISGAVTLNTLSTNSLTFANNSDVLNLAAGGLLLNTGSNTVGTAVGNGSITAGGTASSGVQDLYFWTGTNNNNTNILRSTIIDNGNGAQTRLVVTSRGDGNRPLTMFNGTNSYTGGTVLNTSVNLQATSGVVIPNDATGLTGLVLNNSTLAMTVSSGQIASGNVVTLNGGSNLSLFGNNTLAGLRYTNNYGSAAPTVTSGGTLTLTGGITTTSESDGNGGAAVVGLVSLPSGSTLSIGAATFNTLVINPIQADFVFNGVTGAGSFTKSGNGVMQFNAIGALSGTLDVTSGGLQSGGTNGGSRLLDVTLENGTWLNLNGNTALFGSLATPASGTGYVTNSGALNTLTVGSSNASSTFAGAFQRFSDSTVNLINLTKIGTGILTLTGNSSTASGTLTINSSSGGGVTFSGNGVNNFVSAAVTVNPDSTLVLDNSGVSVNNRLGGALGAGGTGLTLSGGTLVFTANSSGTSETVGATAFNSGQSVVSMTPGSTGTTLLAGTALSKAVGGQALVTDTGYGGIGLSATNLMTFTSGTPALATGGSTTNAVLGWMRVNDGVDPIGFAAYGANGIRALAANEYAATITAGNSANVALITAPALANATTVNSLTLNSGGAVSGSSQTLTITSGGLITNTGNTGISTGFLAFGGTEASIHAVADTSINAVITGSNGLAKDGSGNLTLGARNPYTGQTTINQGSLTLAGGNNTLAANNALVVNKGGTLTLGANNQYVASIVTPGTVENSGGSIGGSGVLTTNGSNGTFAGSIGGSVNLVKAGSNTLTLVSGNPTTGGISVIGGGLTLKDGGTLSGVTGVPAIKVNYATITLDNTNFGNNNDRLNDAAPITLNGSTITYNGAPSVASTETIGALTLASGLSRLNVNPYLATNSVNAGGADLTIGSLNRVAGSAATVYFAPSNNGATSLGTAGLASARVNFTTAPTLTNNIIGPWAITMIVGNQNGLQDFASYIPYTTVNGVTTGGVGNLGSTGYPAYDSVVALNNVNQSNWNVKSNGTITGSNTIYSLNDNQPVFSTPTDMVNLVSGGWILGGNSQPIGTALDSGRITAGGTNTTGINDLYLYNYANGRTFNSRVVDNPSGGSVRLVLVAGDGNIITMLNNLNSYTGGTVLNQCLVTLAATSAGSNTNGVNVIPAGGLTINNTTITETVAAGQINPTNVVTLNGGSGLTLFGNDTLAGLVFNSNGGTSTPTVSIAANTTLTLSGDISSTPNNVAVIPIIKPVSGTANLDLNNSTAHNITVAALPQAATTMAPGFNLPGLDITAVIQSATPANGGFTKLGDGVLELNAVNTFNGGLVINAGAVQADQTQAIGGTTNTVTLNGATAALWMNTGTVASATNTLLVGSNGGQLADVGGDRTLAAPVTLNGPLNVSLSDPTANNVDRAVTISQAITGGGSLTVTGNIANTTKSLILSNAGNIYSGGLTINSGGRVQPTGSGIIGNNSGSLTINTGGVLDLNGTSQVVGNFTGSGGSLTSSAAGTPMLTIGTGDAGGGNFAGAISNGSATVSLTKVGAGQITLSGSNPYGGSTTVNNGTLLINGANTGSGTVSVAAGATIGGTGSIAGALNVSGAVSPGGATIGTLTSGAVTFANNSTYNYQVNSSVAASAGADLHIVNGALSLGSQVALNLANLGSGTFAAGTVFSLFNYAAGLWNSGVLTYNSVALAEDSTFTFAGKTWTIDYDATTKGANVAGAQSGSYVNISTAAAADPFTAWIQTPAFAIPADKQGPSDDPDGDGATNLEEFAFGGNPADSSTKGLVFGIQADSNDAGTAKEMILTIAVRNGVTFSTPGNPAVSDATVDGLNYAIQGSADLVNWTATVTPVQLINPGLPTLPAGYQYVSFSLNGSDGLPGKGFLRAQVVRP